MKIENAGKGIGKIPEGEENQFFFKPYTHWHQISRACYETLVTANCSQELLHRQEAENE